MRIERLGGLGSAPLVLAAVARAAAGRSLAPPAALIGEWFDAGAVIAPSVAVEPVAYSDFGVLSCAERNQPRRNHTHATGANGF